MSSQVSFTISGDAAKLVSELATAVKAFDKAEKGANDVTQSLARMKAEERAAAKEMAGLEREAAKIKTSVQGPMERYSQEVMKLKGHLGAGRIEQHEYNRAVEQLTTEMRQASPAFEKLKASERASADELKRFKAEAQSIKSSITTPIEKYNAELTKLDGHLKKGTISQEEYNRAAAKAETQLKGVGAAGEGAFGSKALGSLTAYAAGAISIGSAVGAVVSALKQIQQIGDDAASTNMSAREGLGMLKQVAKPGDQKDYEYLIAKSHELFESGAVKTRGDAYKAVFDLRSAGEMKNFDLVKELGSSALVADPGDLMASVKAMQKTLGEDETGSARQLISKALKASSASQVQMEPLLQGLTKSNTFAKKIGIGDEDLLAAIAETASASKSAEVGGTQLSSLMASLAELQFKGFKKEGGEEVQFDFKNKGLIERLQEIEGKGLNPAEVFSALGRKEAVGAYDVLLQNRDQFKKTRASINEANTIDVVGMQMGLTTPTMDSSLMQSQASAGLEVSRIGRGDMSATAQALSDQRRRKREGSSMGGALLAGAYDDVQRLVGGDAVAVGKAVGSGEISKKTAMRMAGDDKQAQRGVQVGEAMYAYGLGSHRARPRESDGGGEMKEAAKEITTTMREQRETIRASRPTALGNPDVDK